MESPRTIKDQGESGNRLNEGQTDGDNGKKCLRDEIISGDGRGEGLGIEKFGDAAIDEDGGQGNSDDPVGPGMDQSLPENAADPIQINRVSGLLIDQFRLLLAPCRIHRDMTRKRLRGQKGRAGRRCLENPPGSLSAPHINGVKNNNK